MKKYTIGLITGALLAVSTMMFMGAQNKNLGDITAESIKLVSEHGETFIVGGGILISNPGIGPLCPAYFSFTAAFLAIS